MPRPQHPESRLPRRARPAPDRAPAAARSPTGRPRPRLNTRRRRSRSSGSSSVVVLGIDVDRQLPLLVDVDQRILVRRDARAPDRRRDARPAPRQTARRRPRRHPPGWPGSRQQRRVVPERHAVRAPVAREAQRGSDSPGYHLPCPIVQQPARRERSREPLDAALAASRALVSGRGRGVPLRRRPCRRSTRTSARRPSSAARRRSPARRRSRSPSASISLPLLVGVRLGDARDLRGCASRASRGANVDLALGLTRPVTGAALTGRACGERDVAFAGEQSRGRDRGRPSRRRAGRPRPTRADR